MDLLLAGEIMERMAQAYADCAAYRDSGVMVRTFRANDGIHEETQTFTTAFERPYRFRFEFREEHDRYIVSADAAAARAWWGEREGVQPMLSVDEAIARAVGPSNGTSHTIPRLLMPDQVRGRSLVELENIRRLPDAMLGEATCYRIAGTGRRGDSQVIWIERGTFLVRRIDEEHTFPDFTTTDRTVYYPEVNIELSDEELYLKAPVTETTRGELTARVDRIALP